MHVNKSIAALHNFYQNTQERVNPKSEKRPNRLLLKVHTDQLTGEKYLVARNESDIGFLNRVLTIFGIGSYALKNVAACLQENPVKQNELTTFNKSLQAIGQPVVSPQKLNDITTLLTQKIAHYNEKIYHIIKSTPVTLTIQNAAETIIQFPLGDEVRIKEKELEKAQNKAAIEMGKTIAEQIIEDGTEAEDYDIEEEILDEVDEDAESTEDISLKPNLDEDKE